MSANNDLKVFLADLTYTAPNEYMYPYPLGAGHLGAYLKSVHKDVSVEIFKDPHELHSALSHSGSCDILGLSNYYWNLNLNRQFLRMARSMNPRAITVMGGPNIDSYSDNGIKDFLSNMPQLDFYVPGEGEYKFEMLVNALKNNDMAASRVWTDIPSSVVGLQNNDFKKGSKNVPQYCDLNKMPSCYLTGLMDKFIDDPALVPIIETSRGCPHTCAYCCWGKAERVRRFPLERVYGEIEYIAQRTKIFVNAIYVADANFGSAARDVEIAEKIRKSSIERGFRRKHIYTLQAMSTTIQ